MTFGESSTFMKGVTSPDDEARRVFDKAIDVGMNLVDTANIYGDGASEKLTGAWIAGKRDRVLLATKCRFPFTSGEHKAGPHEQGLSRQHILQACEDSLRRLATDHIDLYQVHMQDNAVPIDETMRALDDLVTQGKVRYVGCSNYTGYRLVEAAWSAERMRAHRFVAAQVQWSLVERGLEREVIPACRLLQMGTLIWSPLAAGFLSGKYKRSEAPPAGSRLDTWKDSFKSVSSKDQAWDVLDAVQAMAKRHETTAAAVSLAWLLAKSEVSSIILGARTAAQLDDNLRALSVKLSHEDVRSLDDVSKPKWGYPYDFIGGRQDW